MKQTFSRRQMIATAGATAAAAMIGSVALAQENASVEGVVKNGRINHSVCLWCYKMSSDKMAPIASKMGLKAIDLLTPKDWKPLKENGLICSMTSGVWGGITKGFNRPEQHEAIIKTLKDLIDANAEAGYPNVICFSGNRGGMPDDVGMKNCAEGVKKIVGYAEQKKVMLCMELLNSRVDHHDYMCDKSAWGVELVKMVGSDHFKLLFDIYHMQIDEGDIIRTIKQHHDAFAHYHTGGIPGRHEIDETQELFYPAVMRAIVETGYKGFVAQEFIPAKKDKIASLAAAVRICDV